jgi:3-dehydroquinate synthase
MTAETPISTRVPLPGREYDVIISRGSLHSLSSRLPSILPAARRALLAFDPNLPASLIANAHNALLAAGLCVSTLPVHASESNKQLPAAAHILDALAAARLERSDPLVALGGGIVGDIAGFAAAIHRRGIPFIQCPTTLLAMVDASVGGKTGVNLLIDGHLTKNMVGCFHQPALVCIDLAALDSLPDREFRAGLAECIKHAMIGGSLQDPSLWDYTLASLPAIIARDPLTLAPFIARNVALKARVVLADERETAPDSAGGRALLNLGHTFAHVIESLQLPSHPLHGEAVALGLLAATTAAHALNPGQLPAPATIASALTTAGLPTTIAGLPAPAELIALMRHDKKSRAGKLRCIFPGPGHTAAVIADPPDSCLRDGWCAVSC